MKVLLQVIKGIEKLAKKCSKEDWKIEKKDYSKIAKIIEKETYKRFRKSIFRKR